MKRSSCVAAIAIGLLSAGTALAGTTTTTFDNGTEGWSGNAEIDPGLGNEAPAFHSLVESFGINWFNDSNPAFIGNYTAGPSATLSVDTLTSSITFLGSEVTRNFFVKLIDFGATDAFEDNLTLYYQLGTLTAADAGNWITRSVTIDDTSALGLPDGWGMVDGDGVIVTGAPPRSFTDVLASIDQITFDTFEPDFFYGFTIFDVAGDNFSVTRGDVQAVPEPASWAMMIAGFGLVGGALRRAPQRSLAAA